MKMDGLAPPAPGGPKAVADAHKSKKQRMCACTKTALVIACLRGDGGC